MRENKNCNVVMCKSENSGERAQTQIEAAANAGAERARVPREAREQGGCRGHERLR